MSKLLRNCCTNKNRETAKFGRHTYHIPKGLQSDASIVEAAGDATLPHPLHPSKLPAAAVVNSGRRLGQGKALSLQGNGGAEHVEIQHRNSFQKPLVRMLPTPHPLHHQQVHKQTKRPTNPQKKTVPKKLELRRYGQVLCREDGSESALDSLGLKRQESLCVSLLNQVNYNHRMQMTADEMSFS